MFWIEKIYHKINPKGFSKYLLSLLITLIPIILVFIPELASRSFFWYNISKRKQISLILGSVWIGLGPYFIHKYITESNMFFDSCKNHCNSKRIFIIQSQFNNTFARDKSFSIIFFVWTSLVITSIILNSQYISSFGIFGYSDIYFYVFCICFIYVLYLHSVGFYGVYASLRIIRYIMKKELIEINFFDSDQHGGIDFIIRYAFKVTMMFSTGLLFIPILFDYILFTNNVIIKLSLYIITLMYGISLLLSFYIPLKAINIYVNQKKKTFIDHLFIEYQESYNILIESQNIDTNFLMKQNAIYNFINFIDKIKIVEVSPNYYIQVFTVTLIPILSLFVNSSDIQTIIKSLFRKYLY